MHSNLQGSLLSPGLLQQTPDVLQALQQHHAAVFHRVHERGEAAVEQRPEDACGQSLEPRQHGNEAQGV